MEILQNSTRCNIEFPNKIFDRIVNKKYFLKISNLFGTGGHAERMQLCM